MSARISIDANTILGIDGTTVTTWNGYATGAVGGATSPVLKKDELFPYVRLGSTDTSTTKGNYINFGPQTFFGKENPLFTSNTQVASDYTSYGWDTSEGWVITSSSTDGYKAFNKTNTDTSDCWLSANSTLSSTTPQLLSIKFPTPTIITSYKITSRNDSTNTWFPTSWRLQGSTNGTTWIDLEDTRTETSWTHNTLKTYNTGINVSNTAYAYYQLRIEGTKNNNAALAAGGSLVAIGEWNLYTAPKGFTAVGVIRFWQEKAWQRWFEFGGDGIKGIYYAKERLIELGSRFEVMGGNGQLSGFIRRTMPNLEPIGEWSVIIARLTNATLLDYWSNPTYSLTPKHSNPYNHVLADYNPIRHNFGYIGKSAHPSYSSVFHSCIDIRETSIYDYALSDVEVSNILVNLRAKYTERPVLINPWEATTAISGWDSAEGTFSTSTGLAITPTWLQMQFPYAVSVNSFQFSTRSDIAPLSFNISYSDDNQNFLIAQSYTLNNWTFDNITPQTFTINESTGYHRWWRMNILAKTIGGTNSWTFINNFRLNTYMVSRNENDIYARGNVGIGTSNPAVKLDILGSIRATGTLNVGVGSTMLCIIDNGRIGIGTIAPIVSLSVVGTDAIIIPKGSTADRSSLTTSAHTGSIRYNTDTSEFEGYSGVAPEWKSIGGGGGGWTGVGTSADIYATGNVGIGSTVPSVKLDVVGDIRSTGTLNIGSNLTVTGSATISDAVTVMARYDNSKYLLGPWTSRVSPPTINQWRSIAWSPKLGIFAAVANTQTNRVMTSSDGITWTPVDVPLYFWFSIAWAPELGLFAAVSNNMDNYVMTSSDGITWTAYYLGQVLIDNVLEDFNCNWQSIVWAPELNRFVAVASDNYYATRSVMTSSDGVNWTLRVAASNNSWNSIAWAPELGLFAAVADSGTGNRVMTSPDGITWTSRTSAVDNDWRSIAWAPELGLFAAVATSGTNRVMTSPDGINWTARSSAVETHSWFSITWAPEIGLFAAVASGGTSAGNRVMTSTDGITWTSRVSASDNGWRSIAWSPKLNMFAAVALNSGTGKDVMTSTFINSIAPKWEVSPATTVTSAGSWHSIAWSPQLRLFAAPNFDNNSVSTSPDGINWTEVVVPSATSQWRGIAWSPQLLRFVVVSNQNEYVLISSDGITWTWTDAIVVNSTPTNYYFAGFENIVWAPEILLFVAVTNNGTHRVMTSPDGINWTARYTGPDDNQWTSIAWAPALNRFVAVCNGNTPDRVMTSSDNGITWTLHTSGVIASGTWRDIVWAPELNLFVAVAGGGTTRVMTSPDGINWTARSSAVETHSWVSITWAPEIGLFVSVARGGNGMSSPDGINWTLQEGTSNTGWSKIAWSPQLYRFAATAGYPNSYSSRSMTLTYPPNGTTIKQYDKDIVFATNKKKEIIRIRNEGISVLGDIKASGSVSSSTLKTGSTIAIGTNAGKTTQGANAIGIGDSAGGTSQGAYAIAIGANAGNSSQGAGAIAIGVNAGTTSQPGNSIIINASGTALNTTTSLSCFIKPIRGSDLSATLGNRRLLTYDSGTSEMCASTIAQVKAAIGIADLESKMTSVESKLTVLESTSTLNDSRKNLNIIGGFSFKKMFTEYTGPAVRLRRASDNQQIDVWFDSNGTITKYQVASGGETTKASTLAGWNTETHYIAIWYDQSLGGKNLIPVDSNQPIFEYDSVLAKNVVRFTRTGKEAMTMEGAYNPFLTTPTGSVQIITRTRVIQQYGNYAISLNGPMDHNNRHGLYIDYPSNQGWMWDTPIRMAVPNSAVTTGQPANVSVTNSPSFKTMRINDTYLAESGGSTGKTSSGFRIGGDGTEGFYSGVFEYVILLKTPLTDAQTVATFTLMSSTSSIVTDLAGPTTFTDNITIGSMILSGGTPTASSSATEYEPSKAFDGSGTGWKSASGTYDGSGNPNPAGTPSWLKVLFPSAKTVVKYFLSSTATTWDLQGSDDDITFTTVHSYFVDTSANVNSGAPNGIFYVDKVMTFKYWRIFIRKKWPSGSYEANVSILTLYTMPPTPPLSLSVLGTDAIQLPKGTTANRSGLTTSSYAGCIRYNTDTSEFEGYSGSSLMWKSIGGGGGWTGVGTSADIYATGNVGIGTNNPTAKLDVLGNLNVRGTVSSTTLKTGSIISIGTNAGTTSQGAGAIAIGSTAGNASQGANAIAIGANAGTTSQHANSIIINASGNALNTNNTLSCIINPIRNVDLSTTTANRRVLTYDTGTSEMCASTIAQVQAALGGVISKNVLVNIITTAIPLVLNISTTRPVQETRLKITGLGTGTVYDPLTDMFSGGNTSSLAFNRVNSTGTSSTHSISFYTFIPSSTILTDREIVQFSFWQSQKTVAYLKLIGGKLCHFIQGYSSTNPFTIKIPFTTIPVDTRVNIAFSYDSTTGISSAWYNGAPQPITLAEVAYTTINNAPALTLPSFPLNSLGICYTNDFNTPSVGMVVKSYSGMYIEKVFYFDVPYDGSGIIDNNPYTVLSYYLLANAVW